MSTIAREALTSRAQIDALRPDGLGHAQIDGHSVAIHGALPGELVVCRAIRGRRQRKAYQVEQVLTTSPSRREPRCRYFGVCAGCSLQHLDSTEQIRHKQDWLLETLREIAGVVPDEILAPTQGPVWNYRRKTRLAVRFVAGKGRVLVGFRERFAPFVTDMQSCEVLDQRIAALIEPLATLVARLSIRQRLPQIEAAAGDDVVALVVRVLDPPTPDDLELLREFAKSHGVQIHLQPKGPDSIRILWAPDSGGGLDYQHHDHRVTLGFEPLQFAQINPAMNRRMVSLALKLLAVGPTDRVLDLFCGVGNFTLPIARRAGEVVGVEGEASLVAMARRNASGNGISNAAIWQSDLEQITSSEHWAKLDYTAALLDPPRSGASAMVELIAALDIPRLVYVSCHADSLARDSKMLVGQHGYRLARIGVLDMFPHTTHFESIALFERS